MKLSYFEDCIDALNLKLNQIIFIKSETQYGYDHSYQLFSIYLHDK